MGLSGMKPDPRQSDETKMWVGLHARHFGMFGSFTENTENDTEVTEGCW